MLSEICQDFAAISIEMDANIMFLKVSLLLLIISRPEVRSRWRHWQAFVHSYLQPTKTFFFFVRPLPKHAGVNKYKLLLISYHYLTMSD